MQYDIINEVLQNFCVTLYIIEDSDDEKYLRQYICPKEYAIRGIRTQVESSKNNDDNTALNNVELDCHKIDVSCTHEFVTLLDYTNLGGLMNERRTI